ncbi:MAG TPA: hypothetical protein VIV61_07485 [Candidatus Ozemobacteraceae bacterium]
MTSIRGQVPAGRSGIAIILVLTFVLCVFSLATAMFYFRKEVKQQNVSNVNFLQANFLAQAGVQHALLKCRILPQEAYDSGMALQGYCPLQAVIAGAAPSRGVGSSRAMQVFTGDCTADPARGIPWDSRIQSDLGLNPADWRYEVASMTVIAAFTKPADRLFVLTSQIIASGTVIEHRGGRGPRSELMTKTIELTRKIN